MPDTEEDSARQLRLLQRTKTVAIISRDTTVNRIQAIHELSKRVTSNPELRTEFLTAVGDLNSLWEKFVVDNQAVLYALLDLGLSAEFSSTKESQVRSLYIQAVAVAETLRPTQTCDDNVSHNGSIHSNRSNDNNCSGRPRLPEIPLPTFSGDLSDWPVFRDRFNARVIERNDLSNIDRFYYLLGCLKDEALHSIRNIVVSDATYDLAWTTLVERFDKPRQLASLIVDKLISIPAQSQESLDGLKDFLTVFSDQVSTLESLNIPDLGEFLLFSLSARCLPLSTRKGFEAINNNEFPTAADVVSYVKNRVSILEAVNFTSSSRRPLAQQERPKPSLRRHDEKRSKVTLHTSRLSNDPALKCLFCSKDHSSVQCPNFEGLSMDARYQTARDKKVCFRCLNSTHWSNRCKINKPCDKCSGRHHSLLHRDYQETEKRTPPQVSMVSARDTSTVLLGTALLHVRDHAGCMQQVRALIDSGSQISVMSTSCVERLGLRRVKWTAPLTGVSGVAVSNVDGLVKCIIAPRYDDHRIHVSAWILPKITGNMPICPLAPQVKQHFSHLALADPGFDRSDPIDLLSGADVYSQVMDGKRIVINDSLPAAFGSLFGWIIIGPVQGSVSPSFQSNVVSLTVSLETIIQRFWQVEEPDEVPDTFTKDGQCESIYISERTRDSMERFVVPLPFLNEHRSETFPGSRQIAVRRFQNLEKKLQDNDTLGQAYRQFMHEYESLGHMSIAPCPGSYFIPHHPVFKGSLTSSKIRVVFDASATASNKLSLNQCLHTGPKLQQDIIDILLRFRVHKYTFTADVCKMYRQILVHQQYRSFQHILWRASTTDELKEYQLNTVTYGVNCAPYLALRVLQDIAEQEGSDFPTVKDALLHQTYVDDVCVGADTSNELVKLQSDLQLVLGRAGLDLKKWSSNLPSILSAVPLEDRASDVIHFDDKEGGVTKVLGLQCNPSMDVFGFNVCPSSHTPTKRTVLSIIARIYDPIGFLAPVIFYAKHIMQRIWKANVSWDDPLPPDLVNCWSVFVDSLPALSKVKVPRFLSTQLQSRVQLCGFCDASEKGYSAVVYLRTVTHNHSVSISLLGSKTKMAPVKTSTVPRLELCAAVLLARWLYRLLTILQDKLNVDSTFAWSDSQIVLSWLVKPHSMFKVFVSNRVHRIHTLLPHCQWGYVRSAINPADCASRGMLPSELISHSLYWCGPKFLYANVDTWDTSPTPIPVEQLPDTKIVSLTVTVSEPSEWICRFSSNDRMLRVISWVRRFIFRCKRKEYPLAFLQASELQESLVSIVRVSQRLLLSGLFITLESDRTPSRSYARLRPFMDSNGLIRIGGRLHHADLPTLQKQPMLLPKTSHLAKLIVRHWHLVTCHSGPRVITALITRNFWIMSVRVVIRQTIGSCTTCVRAIAQSPQPLMADLPAARVQVCQPFSKVGIDYAGPLPMRECRLRKPREYKVYIAVFVCMAVKAVHLELVLELSTDAFLAAFDRFVARRGLPQEIFSDCGTNFVGASKRLSILVNHPENRDRLTARAPCSWNFNPPAAPHFGGLWEAAVRSTKTLLSRVMGCHHPTLEELSTVLCRIEAVLNSRPLTPMSSSPLDLDYLTPGHFLIGRPLLSVPDLPMPETASKSVPRWKLLHQCHQAFWRRWSAEYLCSLQIRNKWTKNSPNLKIGDMVVVKDKQLAPTHWRLGRILSVNPGVDGVVRVVRLLTSQGELTRPVVKLVLLPTE